MLKEYILNLQNENDKKIKLLEQEMQGLMDDLNCSEQLLEKLEQEKLLDTNIFSPRTLNTNVNEKIEARQKEIREYKQKIEYVSQHIEECMKNRTEYDQLEREVIGNADEKSDEIAESKDSSDDVLSEKQIVNSQENGDSASPETDRIHEHKELKTFLQQINRKAQNCLNLLNGNKNRCRSELKSMIKMIGDYEQKI